MGRRLCNAELPIAAARLTELRPQSQEASDITALSKYVLIFQDGDEG